MNGKKNILRKQIAFISAISFVDAAVTGETVVHIGNSEFSVVECPTKNGASFNQMYCR